LAGCFYREIFLAHVDTCGDCDAGDVGAVVDYDADVLGNGRDQGARDFVELARRCVFGAELDQLHAGVGEFMGEGQE
jgi:hypothetical protein